MDANVPFKKLYYVNYVGNLFLHHSYAKSMIPWLVSKVIISDRYISPYCSLSLNQDGIFAKKEELNLIDLSCCKPTAGADSKKLKESTVDNNSVSSASLSDDLSLSSVGDEQLLKASFEQLIECAALTLFKKSYFFVLVNTGDGTYFNLFVFHHCDAVEINEIAGNFKKFQQWHEKQSKASGLPSRNVKLEDLASIRFEVMFLGKLQLFGDLSVQADYIDGAVQKYHSLELEHAATKEEFKLISNLSKEVSEVNVVESSESNYSSLIDGSRLGAAELMKLRQNNRYNPNTKRRPSFDGSLGQRCNSIDSGDSSLVRPKFNRTRHCSEPSAAASMGFDKNKTRIFQIGKRSLTIISPDQSVRSVEILFSAVESCSKGVKNNNHFGVFVKDAPIRITTNPNNKTKEGQKFKCYLFRCSDESVCDEILQAIKQSRGMCAHGPEPMTLYHALCKQINSTSGSDSSEHKLDKGTNLTASYIFNAFSDAEQKKVRQMIEDRCRERPPESKYERLVIVMDKIRLIFEERQLEHDVKVKQLRDPQANNVMSKRLTFIKSRAKKSLSSIENIWGKGLQKMQELQQEAENHIQSPVERFRFFADNHRSAPNTPAPHHGSSVGGLRVRHHSESPASMMEEGDFEIPSETYTPKSNTLGSPSQGSIGARRKLKMSAMSVDEDNVTCETPVGNKKSLGPSSPHLSASSSPNSLPTPDRCVTCSAKKLSERQKIFIRVATPRSHKSDLPSGQTHPLHHQAAPDNRMKTPDQVRLAWRRAIQDQITLNKIEKLTAFSKDEEMSDPLRSKLESRRTDDCPPDMSSVWEELLETDDRERYKMDINVLHAAVKKGVPMRMRCKVWMLLHEQWKLRQRPDSQSAFALPKTSYKDLLKQLTSDQHAILIDLGRTFPTHPYFNQQLADGQLALFNLLKAYALLDKDVGYCQGLNFVAGFLLLHTPTAEEAFSMLCRLMADMGCRKMYLPDMETIQVSVYQLSRLLYDFHRDLHEHFEMNDINLTMFVTPWFLTMFSSVLSLTFTARIFDLLFLEGRPALFKAALCLFGFHKSNLLSQDCFEDIVGYLKTSLTEMKNEEISEVLNEIFTLDIEDTLLVYEAEFTVFQDEGLPEKSSDTENIAHELETKFTHLQQKHQSVTKYNLDLLEKLEAARIQISSLQQGLTDMAVINEETMMQMERLKQENQMLKRA